MKRKLGITCDCITQNDPLVNLDIIKNTGFDCFFTEHGDMNTVSAIKEKADKLKTKISKNIKPKRNFE